MCKVVSKADTVYATTVLECCIVEIFRSYVSHTHRHAIGESDQSPPTRSLSLAQIALHGTLAHATSVSIPANISIYDPTLHLLAFARMDKAKITSISIAMSKAFTAAVHRVSTDVYGERVELEGGLHGIGRSNNGRPMTIAGGEPVVTAWEDVGAVGVNWGYTGARQGRSVVGKVLPI